MIDHIMAQLFASILFYLIVIISCEFLRRATDSIFEKSSPIKIYIYEFLAALEVCTCIYENSIIVKNFGVLGFFLVVLTLLNLHRLLSRGALVSPSYTVESWIDGKFLITVALGLLVAQLLGGFGAFRFAQQIWWFEFSADHAFHAEEYSCILAYKVPMWLVASFEFFGAFLIRTIISITSKHYPPAVPFVTALCFAAGLSLGILVIGSPGLNPIIAFARFFGCKGINRGQFFMVYWIASMSGWLTAYFLETKPKTMDATTKKLKND